MYIYIPYHFCHHYYYDIVINIIYILYIIYVLLLYFHTSFSINLMIHGSNKKTTVKKIHPNERLVHLKMGDELNLESHIPGGG